MHQTPRLIATGALAICLAAPAAALADVKLPAFFGDHMVLQQELPIPVWGTADPGEAVTVSASGESAKTTAGPDGKWMVKLDPLSPSDKATTLTVTGKNTLTFQDVLIGEVWVCSGQSNMEFPLQGAHNAATAIPAATDPQLRLFHVDHKTSHTPVDDVKGKWELSSPATVRTFTAVGYFFGKELRARLKRPVGLIESNWGGTPAQAWTSLDGLGKDPILSQYVKDWHSIDANYTRAAADYPAAQAAFRQAQADWNTKYQKDWIATLAQWNQAVQQAVAAKQPLPRRPATPAPMPQAPADPEGGPNSASTLYNGMIHPLQPFAIRGAIWYQGESNAGRAEEYRTLFPRMITDWREKWGEGDFPFLFVQLAAFGHDEVGWPVLRDAQAGTLSLPKTGMATAIDIGLPDNIHPMDKEDVGKRLALSALHVAYGQRLIYSGPIFKSLSKNGSSLAVSYKHLGGGLVIGKSPWIGPHAEALPMDRLVGFEIAGADGKWAPADAKIDDDTVVLSGSTVLDPVAARYDWKAYPEGNLYNKAGLPATPFTGKAQ